MNGNMHSEVTRLSILKGKLFYKLPATVTFLRNAQITFLYS